MTPFRQQNRSVSALLGVIFAAVLLCASISAQTKNPMILIPGISGSELVHKGSMKKVWFRITKTSDEDLRLPLAADPTKMHDNLIASDVLRRVKIGIFPVTDIYGGFVKAMVERGGYHEEKWDKLSDKGADGALFTFPYDWRLDNVLNARLLVRRMDELRRRLKRPDLKFDIVAHSMGGIISRYAAMYGDADLPARGVKIQPSWAGSRYIDRVILLGTPNEGSTLSLGIIQSGFSIGNFKIDLPFIQDVSKFTVFTIPAGFELLPAPGTLKVFNEKLEPISIDLYDPKVWSKYGWNVIDDPKFAERFTAAERKTAPIYFANILDRAKRLQEALTASNGKTAGVTFYVVGSDCKTTLDSIIVYKDTKENKWKTILRPKGFVQPDGQKVTDEDVRKIMYKPGDGIVTRRSLGAETESEKTGIPPFFSRANETYICEEHNKLATNSQIQDYIIGVLTGKAAAPTQKEKSAAAGSRQ
jgi:pimeloyl-ACP methyl ester carboxylesterase